jgi:hypothetical protein
MANKQKATLQTQLSPYTLNKATKKGAKSHQYMYMNGYDNILQKHRREKQKSERLKKEKEHSVSDVSRKNKHKTRIGNIHARSVLYSPFAIICMIMLMFIGSGLKIKIPTEIVVGPSLPRLSGGK